MNIMLVVIICLILHIILCVILYLLIRLGILVSNPMVMVLAWLVPLWGPLCLAVLEIRSRGDQEIREEAGLEKLKINDQVYRSILMEEEVQEDRIVPLEAAYEGIQAVLDRWPKEEAGYLRLIQYYSHIRDRNGIDRVLAMIRHRHIFLSPEGRGTVRFWEKDGGWEKGGGG